MLFCDRCVFQKETADCLYLPSMLSVILLFFTLTVAVLASDEKGLAFLAEKKKDPDVVALPSGLLYKVLKKGDGLYHPGPSTPCSCHYAGTLIDGTEFDSSYGRGSPTTFAPNQGMMRYGCFLRNHSCHSLSAAILKSCKSHQGLQFLFLYQS